MRQEVYKQYLVSIRQVVLHEIFVYFAIFLIDLSKVIIYLHYYNYHWIDISTNGLLVLRISFAQ
jgi:hypothetical protein